MSPCEDNSGCLDTHAHTLSVESVSQLAAESAQAPRQYRWCRPPTLTLRRVDQVGYGEVNVIVRRVGFPVGEVDGGRAQRWVVCLQVMNKHRERLEANPLQVQPRGVRRVLALWQTAWRLGEVVKD